MSLLKMVVQKAMILMALLHCISAFIVVGKNIIAFTRRGSDVINPLSFTFASVSTTRGGGYDVENLERGNNKLDLLIEKAQHHLREKNADQAFATLAEAYGIDPTSTTIAVLFQSCLELKVELTEAILEKWKVDPENNTISEAELTNLFQDRMGLSSLLIDKEEYDEAGVQLRKALEEANCWLKYFLNTSTINTQIDLSNTRFAPWQPHIDRAQYLLYRTNAACCKWNTYFEDGNQLSQSISRSSSPSGHVQRLLHPFDGLKFPCISLELASTIAQSYAARALETHGLVDTIESNKQRRPTVTVNRQELPTQQRKLKVGYISPDFNSRHPLAFLMQHVFRYHDESKFSIYMYSLSSKVDDNGPEVEAIQESCERFTYLSPTAKSPKELYQRMVEDDLDIIVDLCGYAGTSIMTEIMASRPLLQQKAYGSNGESASLHLPIHCSYMGYPGSIGSAQIWDYSIFDKVVVPPDDEYGIREHYNEALVYMPHCYFVNSHKTVLGKKGEGIVLASEEERMQLRSKYGINSSAFVYCCHSRPDKIDPTTFRSWIRALSIARSDYFAEHPNESNLDDSLNGAPILWLLRSGKEMEYNLRHLVRTEFGERMEDALVFADIAERNEHLRRLQIADVFLDTPAYNAHTLGCDALYLGLPMISLLRDDSSTNVSDDGVNNGEDVDITIGTEKLASRVGASLLRAASIGDLVCSNMSDYEDLMIRCAADTKWFESVRRRLCELSQTSPLFDTERWVRNLEAAFLHMTSSGYNQGSEFPDIIVADPE